MIRVKVEIVPHGIESQAEVLDEVVIANDGTGRATGENEGGWGNYEVFDGDFPRNVDYPHMYAAGFIKHVERSPDHRIFLAEQALGIVQETRKLAAEGEFDKPHSAFDRPTRNFEQSEAAANCPAKECLDAGGYCKNGDCLAAK